MGILISISQKRKLANTASCLSKQEEQPRQSSRSPCLQPVCSQGTLLHIGAASTPQQEQTQEMLDNNPSLQPTTALLPHTVTQADNAERTY